MYDIHVLSYDILNITGRCKKYNIRQQKKQIYVVFNCIRDSGPYLPVINGGGWPMKVAILGAGMGGSALALWLRSSQQFRLWAFDFSAKKLLLARVIL